MNADDIKPGRCYAAAKPAPCRAPFGQPRLMNDRQVKWMSTDKKTLQYDGPAVRQGAKYPMVTTADFAAWAGRDVTEEMPRGEWRVATRGVK